MLPTVGSIPHYEEVDLCVGIIIICIISPLCWQVVLECRLWIGKVGECGAYLLLQSWRARHKRVMFSANMCLLTIMYRALFAKTEFLFATCWIGKLCYLCVCLVMLQYIVALIKR